MDREEYEGLKEIMERWIAMLGRMCRNGQCAVCPYREYCRYSQLSSNSHVNYPSLKEKVV
ncbi:MAG TPA: hypothetical protein ENG42_02130 [Candidatus Aenigmarchaeota archaeon]|nr:hypothetical protein [Candidatus Aenigmarchaeota archaeon]